MITFWRSMWAPLTRFFSGRQSEGIQTTGPGYDVETAVPVSADTAFQLSAVWACVRLISQTIASLPVVVYRRTPEGREIDDAHWFSRLMRDRPNQYQTRYEFFEFMLTNLVLHGNCYAKINRVGSRIVGLHPMAAQQVETRLVDGKVVHLFQMNGNVTALAAESVWHVRMNGDWLVGRSPLQFGAQILGISQAIEGAVTKIYRNGGKPSGVLSLDRLLTAAQRAQLRENFSSLTTGTDDRLLVLELGAKFDPISMSPEDIELLASRRFQIEEICRWFGVPSVLVNDTSGSTTWGSGIAQIVEGFYKLNLRPTSEALENSISTNLFSAPERDTHEVEFDFEALHRSDIKTRYESYRVGIAGGFLKPNEARAMEWLPRVEGGDNLMIQGATVPITDAGRNEGDSNGI
jgi:HK97 family phage portal protein